MTGRMTFRTFPTAFKLAAIKRLEANVTLSGPLSLIFNAVTIDRSPVAAMPNTGCCNAEQCAQTLIKKSKLVLLANEIYPRLCCVAAISFLAVPGATTEAR